MRGMSVFATRASALAVFLVLCLAPHFARADFTVASILPELPFGAHGVDAHDNVAYVVGDGVTAVNVADADAPRVINTLTDPDLRGCTSVAAYTTSRGKRLAVACSGSNSVVVVDASAPNDGLRVLGVVQDDTALSGVSSVVVKETLAFVTAAKVQRVVSLDLSSDETPRILSFVPLSAADAVTLADEAHIAVGAGNSHGGGRVTVLSYVPSGVMMKVGSIKDGRLGGTFHGVSQFPANDKISFAVTDANGGSVIVVNATTRARPTIAVGLQAQGRAAASAPLSEEDETDDANAEWTPNGHRSLAGARAFAMASNRVAYVASADTGTVVGIDATDLKRPLLSRIVSDTKLRGVSDICAQGGRTAAAAAAKASAAPSGTGDEAEEPKTAPTTSGAVLFAVVPSGNRLVVLKDGGASSVVPTPNDNDEL